MFGTVSGLGTGPKQLKIPGIGYWTILYKTRYKLATRRKRSRRLQKKINNRNGHLHYSNSRHIVVFKLVNATERDLDPKLLEEWTWLGEIYRSV